MKKSTISRRAFAHGAAAGLGFGLLGCSDLSLDDGQKFLPPVAKFNETGHRIFIVQPADGPVFTPEILQRLKPVPTQVIGVRHAFEKQYPKWDYFIWATQEEADKLAKEARVKSVQEKQASDVCDIGELENAKGLVAVRFLPNSEYFPGESKTFATIPQIIAEWREATRGVEGLIINPAPEPDTSIEVGEVPEANQVVIEFKTPKLDPMVLELVRQHPQTMYLKWGAMFTVLYCPPCGMG